MPNKNKKVFMSVKIHGGPAFTLIQFHGIERLSSLFEYQLTLLSPSRTAPFEKILGKLATVSITAGDKTRTFTGMIGHFEQEGTPFNLPKAHPSYDLETVYRATLYPAFWLLKFSGQCRSFQHQSAHTIIKKVFKDHKLPHEDKVHKHGKRVRDFCVQYNETDFDFVSRLMEEEGIFYFFDQTPEGHRLVLGDAPSAHKACPHEPSASFDDRQGQDPFLLTVTSCFIKKQLGTSAVNRLSFNYLTPKTPLKAHAAEKPMHGTLTTYKEIYKTKSEGEALAKIQLEELECPKTIVKGTSTNPFFLAGYKFKLKDHPRHDANIEYTLYEIIHEAHLSPEEPESLYTNHFEAFPAHTPFRPAALTPKPRIYGTQTAKVTGKMGEEIETDKYGRIKVRFHWDPSKEEKPTSCWIRVATTVAGQGWGTVFTPRVGMEVVVSFIDGDPDNPLVIGSVYNGDHLPPYLPKNDTKSTLKSKTFKGAGNNEFWIEDKKGKEEIYWHAQKDLNIAVEANSSLKITKGNHLIEIKEGNMTVTCKKGNATFTVTGNMSITCTQNFSVKAKTITLTSDSSAELTTKGPTTVKASGPLTLQGATTTIKGALVNLNG